MAMEMPPPSPRTEKRRLSSAAEDLEVLASPSKRGTPKFRSFFSSGPEVPRTPNDVSWIREQAGTTPRALDRDFLAASPASEAGGGGTAKNSSTPAVKSKMFNRRTWTQEENEQLQQGMAALGGPEADLGKNEWNTISHVFLRDSRTGTQCATHWKMVLKPSLLKKVWSMEEDGVIYDCIARGVSDWTEVASLLPKRKAKHCRNRWNNFLDPTLKKGEWSAEEQTKLVSAVKVHGASWNIIAKQLPGRSEAMIEQHWNMMVTHNAVSPNTARRGRKRADGMSAPGSGARGRVRPSTLPVEPGFQLPGQDLLIKREGGVETNSEAMMNGGAGVAMTEVPEQVVTLTEREKALMDHAFKTGLTAAVGVGGGGPPQSPNLMDDVAKGGGVEQLTLSTEEEDIFAPLTAALLDGGDSPGCSPTDMPPPSPTYSPLKPYKQQPDYNSVGETLGDGWGVDDDPALADLYRSLDNIGECFFNEDNLDLSFDFDSVDKPAPSCSASCSTTQTSLPKGCDTLSIEAEKEESPFRRAAAKAAATLEQGLSPPKRGSQIKGQGRGLEDAVARAATAAAAAAAAAATVVQAVAPVAPVAPPPTVPVASSSTVPAIPSSRVSAAGPRVKQGFLRRLLSVDNHPEQEQQQQRSHVPFSTVRGCLSEANAPLSPPPPATRPISPANRRSGTVENSAPRRGQPLFVALFAQQYSTAWTPGGSELKTAAVVAPTLRHGKAEVKVPPPQALGQGNPLSLLPHNTF